MALLIVARFNSLSAASHASRRRRTGARDPSA